MKFISSYYRRSCCGKQSGDSLLLQQVTWGKIPVLLACVCGEETSGYVTGRLLDWLYREGLSYCKRGAAGELKKIGRSLEKTLWEIDNEIKNWREEQRLPSFSGLLCVGGGLLLFYRGAQRIYAMNTRFLRPHLKCLAGGEHPGLTGTGIGTELENRRAGALHIQSGSLQPGIGILLALEGFFQGLTEEMIRECLAAGELRIQTQLDRRLKELGEAAVRQIESDFMQTGQKAPSEDGGACSQNLRGRSAILVCTK